MKGRARHIPNGLTLTRIVLVPLFAWLLLAHPAETPWRLGATAVFAVAMATDFADGRIARHYGLETTFGALVDPAADKLLTGAGFVGLSLIGEVWWPITAAILAREAAVTVLRGRCARRGVVMAANRGGKLKTAAQSAALIVLLLPGAGLWRWLGWSLLAAALVLTYTSAWTYFRAALARPAPRVTATPARDPAGGRQ